MTTLEQAIEQLYAAFEGVPKPQQIDGCPHCIDEKGIDKLLATPLRQLSPDDLSAYAFSAFLTVGDKADYLYFLPRILEISITDDSWVPDVEVTGRAIRAAEPESWTLNQRTALLNFLEAVINTAIQSGEYYRLDDWLCAIARMDFDVGPYLKLISRSKDAVLAYFEDNVCGLQRGKLSSAYWELPSRGHDTIIEWLQSEEVQKMAFEAYGFVMEQRT